MKKLVLLSFISIFMLSCENGDVDFPFSDAQKHAYNVLNGKFTDTGAYSTGYGADVIDFYNVFTTPLIEYYTDKTIKGIYFGECSYYDAYAKTTSYYYYYIYDNAESIAIYNKLDKSLHDVFDIVLIDEISFFMFDSDLSMPYKFVKK